MPFRVPPVLGDGVAALRVLLLQANALKIPLPDKSVDTIPTSPPYYGLRDYGVGDQIGLEPTLQEYIANIVAVFDECWRVLKDDGTVWLNMGDSYCNTNGYARAQKEWQREGRNDAPANDRDLTSLHNEGYKTKDLMMVPHRVAIALQERGWYVRSDIVWAKGNPMPESVRDRPTKSHEYLFLLSKKQKYFYDRHAILEEADYDGRHDTVMKGSDKYKNGYVPNQSAQTLAARGHERWPDKTEDGKRGRNKRSVWKINTIPYSSKTEISHLRRAAKDAVSDGMMHIVFPNCPIHGDQFDQVAREFYDGYEGDLMNRIQHICTHLSQTPFSDYVPTDQQIALGFEKQSSGYHPRRYSPTAIDHNNQIHKMALALDSSPAYIPFFEKISRIADRRELLVSFVQHLCIYGNSILTDDFDARLAPNIPHRILGKLSNASLKAFHSPECNCLIYEYYTKKPDHFATFPPEIPELCIKAGTSEKGNCPECGKPWVRVVEKESHYTKRQDRNQPDWKGPQVDSSGWEPPTEKFIGWKPTCGHNLDPVPAVVLDPFGGSGTTAQVANALGRVGISLDLSWEYLQLAKERTGLSALDQWQNGIRAEANLEGLPMFKEIS